MSTFRIANAVAVVKLWVKFALMVAAFFAALRFIFEFGAGQAFGLGLCFSVAIDWASSRKPPAEAHFTPHRLSIQFHLYPMLRDIGLITDDEQWKTLIGEEPPAAIWQQNSVYYHTIVCYVIATNPGLVHYPAMGRYTQGWNVDIQLEGLQRAGEYVPWTPRVFVKPGSDGYHIGVRVNKSWWEANKSKVPAGVVVTDDQEWEFASVRLSFAVLPHQVLHLYYRDAGRGYRASAKELAAKNGWTNDSLGSPEIGYFGEAYEHKYANVWAQHLRD